MKKNFRLNAFELRCRAEKVYEESEQIAPSLRKQADLQRLVHELQVHQIELEMQNEELLRLSADLKVSNEKYTDLYEFAPVGYITLSRNGIIQQINLTGALILGEERIKLLQRRLDFSVADSNRSVFRAILEKAFESQLIATCVLKLSKTDGKLIYVHLKAIASPDGNECHLAMVDITDRKKAEDALKSSEQKYRLLTENASDVIWVLNLAKNKFTYMSPSIVHLNGFTAEEAMNASLDEILTPESLVVVRDVAKSIKDFIQNPKAPHNLITEVQRLCKNGDIIWIEISMKLRYNSAGDIEIVGVSRNIEERKKSEKELVAAKEQAEAASNAQSQFLTNMSHEIKTPMTGLMGMLQLLQMTELTKEQAEYIKISKTSSDSLLNVINDILEYSKIDAGKLKIEKLEFNLDEFLNEIETMFKPSVLNKGLALNMLIEDNVPHKLLGDSFRLRQVLSNIIGNAIKFTEKGRIELIVRKLDERNNEVKLEWVVQDTGIGLSRNTIKDIFNSFSQADSSITRQYGGTGLGLSICNGLVELMQGEIWVESKEGEGSRFYFTCVLDA